MPGLEPAAADDSIIQPSITKLLSLAELRVGGNPDAEVVGRFPLGFGGLSALTHLAICKVETRPSSFFLMTVRNLVQNVSSNGAAHETSKGPSRLMRTTQVYFIGKQWGTPLQGGLEALRVLELVDCVLGNVVHCLRPASPAGENPANKVCI